jgi:predicted RNase H-like HicB family nuclease
MTDHGYALVIEKTATGYSIYAPDLPGCVAVGTTRAEALQLMEEAIRLHVGGMRDDGLQVPAPTSEVTYAAAS